MRTALLLLMTATLMTATLLAGCGKKGAPSPPGPPDQIIYPRTYPAF